jgi:Holliday junction resolvase RusA-like endonuclease
MKTENTTAPLSQGQKAAATRKRNYGLKASREHIDEMLKELPDVSEEELMNDLRFFETIVAVRDYLERKSKAA